MLERRSLIEFFRDCIVDGQRRSNVVLGETTQFYLVNMLVEFIESDKLHASQNPKDGDEAFALALGRAIHAPSTHEKFIMFRQVGDRALYLTGFFSDSLKKKIVDMDYFIALGENAYHSAGTVAKNSKQSQALSDTFQELSEKFINLADLIAQISERSGLTSDKDLLRLYERWLHTGSKRIEGILRENGIVTSSTEDTEQMH